MFFFSWCHCTIVRELKQYRHWLCCSPSCLSFVLNHSEFYSFTQKSLLHYHLTNVLCFNHNMSPSSTASGRLKAWEDGDHVQVCQWRKVPSWSKSKVMFTFVSKSEVGNPVIMTAENKDVSFVKIHGRGVEFKIKQDVIEVQASHNTIYIGFRTDIHVMRNTFRSLCSVTKT